MTNNFKHNRNKQNTEKSNSGRYIRTGNIPAVEKTKNRAEKKRDHSQRIISQVSSPHKKGMASRTAITSLMTSQIASTAKAPMIIARKKGGKKERKDATA
jgi:hypothetical protein